MIGCIENWLYPHCSASKHGDGPVGVRGAEKVHERNQTHHPDEGDCLSPNGEHRVGLGKESGSSHDDLMHTHNSSPFG